MHSARSTFFDGVRAFAPISFGVVPFALVSGVAAVSAGLSLPMAIAMSLLVFAGSAQLVATQLISAHTPALLIIAATAIVNLRFVMYSASLAPIFQGLGRIWKWGCAYLMTDQAYAITISRATQSPNAPFTHWYYLGGALTMWLVWQLGTLAGLALGAQVPPSWQLDFTIPLTFIALVVPSIKNRRFGAVAIVAGVMAALTAGLPFKLGLLLSLLISIGVGLWLDLRAK